MESASIHNERVRDRRTTGARMLTELLHFINEHHGTLFTAGARYPTGEQGAFAIAAGAARFVLKWRRGTEVPAGLRAAAATTGRLRAVGYPTPSYRIVGFAPTLGVSYSVQEALAGTPLGARLDGTVLDRLLGLNELQRGQAGAGSRDWPGQLIETVLRGGAGFCLLEPLRAYSPTTAGLLAALQRLVAGHVGERAPTDDVVPFDFQGANILVERGRVSGVVDWEGTVAGDVAFDLATLFFLSDDDEGAGAAVAVDFPVLPGAVGRDEPVCGAPILQRLTHAFGSGGIPMVLSVITRSARACWLTIGWWSLSPSVRGRPSVRRASARGP